TLLRYSLFFHLVALPFYVNLTWKPALFLIIQLAGLRSYVRAVRQWWRMKSPQFNPSVLLSCFWMIEITRFNYLRGYTTGWLGRDKKQKELAQKLRAEIS